MIGYLIMKLKNQLTKQMINLSLQGTTKEQIIEELLDQLVASGKNIDRSAALSDLFERERKMSTGMQFGVAIPHAKTRAVNELVACIGISKEGVEFDSLDGEPARIFIMTLSSVDRTGPHMQFLAEVSMVLKTAEVRKRVIEAETPEELLMIFGVDA